MTDLLPLLGAALVTGLLGSAHCFGMCAGISGLIGIDAGVATTRTQLSRTLAYNLGRVATYAMLGTLVALLGQSLVDLVPKLVAPVRLASGILIVLVGLQVAFGWRLLSLIEGGGAKLWQRIAPAARHLVPVRNVVQAFAFGMIWGWLPCGLVYSVLLLAATTADALAGAVTMAAFGLGTMPAMVATGISATKLAHFVSHRRLGAGLLIIALGLATLAMPVMKFATQLEHEQHAPSSPR